MAATDTLINQVFDGRYRVTRRLGTGGMAIVYLAEDQELGRRVAIKILNDRHAHDDQFVERFRREAKNAAGLSHPNIVSIYDRGEAGGSYYIAMEYLEGRTLKELIVTRGPSPIHVAIDYARQILAAIGFAHRNGIVHRDIKPHNVLVGPDGRLKVTDFGIARSSASQMTEAGSIIGTAQYLSPEQARGAPVDARSDLYSVGVVLYEMLTGSVPFTGATPLEIAMKHLSTVPEPPSRLRPEIPHDLDLVVLRALAKDPHDRYQTAEELDTDLARVARGAAVSSLTVDAATAVLAGEGTAVLSPTAITRAPTSVIARPGAPAAPPPPTVRQYQYEPPPPRRPFWPWLLALGLLVAAGAAAYLLWGEIQNQLNANKPVAVPMVTGVNVHNAVRMINDAHLKPDIRYNPSATVPFNVVIDQSPKAGDRVDRGNTVTLLVSNGKPRTKVPDVRGKQATDAVSTLKDAHLDPRIFYLNSSADEGTVTGQDPRPEQIVTWGTRVRINVSKGPAPVPVPPVVQLPYETALERLQAEGFAVARQDVDSEAPKGIVVDQQPNGNATAPPGSTVTLSVSKGPKEVEIPDVGGLDSETARATLRDAGFRVFVAFESTDDPNQDDLVLSQDPAAGQKAVPGSQVSMTVGRFVEPTTTEVTTTDTLPTTTEPTTTEPTTTAPTTTAPTTTAPTTTAPTTTAPTTTAPTTTAPTTTAPTTTAPTTTTVPTITGPTP